MKIKSMIKTLKRAIIQKLIFEDDKSCLGKYLIKFSLIKGHFRQETSIPMSNIEIIDSVGDDPTTFKWENSVYAKAFDLAVTGAFLTVLALPLGYKFGTIAKQKTIRNSKRNVFEFNFEEQLSKTKLDVLLDNDSWD